MNESKEFDKIFEALIAKDSKQFTNENDQLIYSGIREVLEQIQWNLKTEKKQLNDIDSLNQSSNKQQHIMISYNTGSRELCLKIKKELESMGHRVWIDVEQISGSSLEAMANAVENSFCVLMCVTEKYRQSINCRAEAKYAFGQNKHIIPLIMQHGFENPQGWLGLIMGDKIFVNFMKYDFVESIRRLKSEIDSIRGENKSETCNSNIEKKDSAKDWTEAMVNEWFIKNGLNLLIFEHFKPFDGKILKQLYDTKQAAPEFYFQAMSKIGNVEFKDIMSFGACLDGLF